jgi:hypothetical protein
MLCEPTLSIDDLLERDESLLRADSNAETIDVDAEGLRDIPGAVGEFNGEPSNPEGEVRILGEETFPHCPPLLELELLLVDPFFTACALRAESSRI